MQYQFLHIEEIQLAFLESNVNSGNIIFFIHGNSSSARTWVEQLNCQDLSLYKLIAIELPAHGQSDLLNDTSSDYSLPDLGRIIAKAVKQYAGESPFILAGVSLGTNIIAEMLAYDIHPVGIILIGSCIIGGEFTMDNVFIKEADLHAGFTDSISEQDLIEYSQLLFTSKKTKERHNFFADFKSVKDNFRSKMFTSVVDGKISKEIDLLRRTHLPLLIIFGENEKICIKTYLDNSGLYLWKEQTFQIKDAGHFAHIDQPESINKLISEYADEIFNTI